VNPQNLPVPSQIKQKDAVRSGQSNEGQSNESHTSAESRISSKARKLPWTTEGSVAGGPSSDASEVRIGDVSRTSSETRRLPCRPGGGTSVRKALPHNKVSNGISAPKTPPPPTRREFAGEHDISPDDLYNASPLAPRRGTQFASQASRHPAHSYSQQAPSIRASEQEGPDRIHRITQYSNQIAQRNTSLRERRQARRASTDEEGEDLGSAELAAQQLRREESLLRVSSTLILLLLPTLFLFCHIYSPYKRSLIERV
jgi:hypothetical protein